MFIICNISDAPQEIVQKGCDVMIEPGCCIAIAISKYEDFLECYPEGTWEKQVADPTAGVDIYTVITINGEPVVPTVDDDGNFVYDIEECCPILIINGVEVPNTGSTAVPEYEFDICKTYFGTVDAILVEGTPPTAPATPPAVKNEGDTIIDTYNNGTAYFTCTGGARVLDNQVIDCCPEITVNGEDVTPTVGPEGQFIYDVETCCTYFGGNIAGTIDSTTPPTAPVNPPAVKNENDTVVEIYNNGAVYFTCIGGAWVLSQVDLDCCPVVVFNDVIGDVVPNVDGNLTIVCNSNNQLTGIVDGNGNICTNTVTDIRSFHENSAGDYITGFLPSTTGEEAGDTIKVNHENGCSYFTFDGTNRVLDFFVDTKDCCHYNVNSDSVTYVDGTTTSPQTLPTNPNTGDTVTECYANGIAAWTFDGTNWVLDFFKELCDCPEPTVAITFDANGNPDSSALAGKNAGTYAKGTFTDPDTGCVFEHVSTIDGDGNICIVRDPRDSGEACYNATSETLLPVNAIASSIGRVCRHFVYFKDCNAAKGANGWVFKIANGEYRRNPIQNQFIGGPGNFEPGITGVSAGIPYVVGGATGTGAAEGLEMVWRSGATFMIPAPRCDIEVNAPQAFAAGYEWIIDINTHRFADFDRDIAGPAAYYLFIEEIFVNGIGRYNVGGHPITHRLDFESDEQAIEEFQDNDNLNGDAEAASGIYRINQGAPTPYEIVWRFMHTPGAVLEKYDFFGRVGGMYRLISK